MDDLARVSARIEPFIDDGVNIRKPAYGRVDAIVGDYVAALKLAEENGLDFKPLSPVHSTNRPYPSFNVNKADLHKLIDGQLAEMVGDGTIEEVCQRYLGKSLNDIRPY